MLSRCFFRVEGGVEAALPLEAEEAGEEEEAVVREGEDKGEERDTPSSPLASVERGE